MAHNLFVYGTLLQRDNEFADYLARHSSFLNAGKIAGTLYDIGEYPGLIIRETTGHWVFGNIYQVDDEALSLIDDYEGYGRGQDEPYLFERIMATIETNGDPIEAWVYVYNRSVEALTTIPYGDYNEYIRQKKSPGI